MKLPMVWNEGLKKYYEQLLRQKGAQQFRWLEVPSQLENWEPEKLRERIWDAMGVRVDHSLDLDVQYTGTIQCEGYTIKNLHYQSRPGVRVSASLYIPDGPGPFPGVINMHGHWAQGHLAARVQQRGHILARMGYVCLSVDAMGAGDRTVVHGEYAYHGGLLGGTLFNCGESLIGAQVVDNMRGVDLLCALENVDPERIGACGASGGGNQTMWLAALDTRIKAAAPVVSVGTFESYLMNSNCICELLPGGLTFTEEGAVLALTAPRALMPCNGMYDTNAAFNVSQMLRSVEQAAKVYEAMGAKDKLNRFIFNNIHGFWPEVQEAVLGWFEYHLKGKGSGAPVTLPSYEELPEEALRVWKDGERPADFATIPLFIDKLARELKAKRSGVFTAEELDRITGARPGKAEELREFEERNGFRRITVREGNILTPMLLRAPKSGNKYYIVSAPYGKSELESSELFRKLDESGAGLAIIDLFGCGENDVENTKGTLAFSLYSRTLIWFGETLQGRWLSDYRRAADALELLSPEAEIAAAGLRDTAITSLLFAATEEKAVDLMTEGLPASFSYSPDRMAALSTSFLIPGILKLADVEDLLGSLKGKVENYGIIE